MRERLVDMLLATLWLPLALSSWVAWVDRRAPLAIGLLAVNLLVIALFLVRRPSRDLTSRPLPWILAVTGTTLPLLLRPVAAGDGWPAEATAALSLVLQGVAVAGILCSRAVLGRSFGLVPAHRGLVTVGPYRLVRHPLYTCEMAFYVAFVLGNLSAINCVLLAAYLVMQARRAREEERVLIRDLRYRDYKRAVPFRFIPGVV